MLNNQRETNGLLESKDSIAENRVETNDVVVEKHNSKCIIATVFGIIGVVVVCAVVAIAVVLSR